MIDQLLSQLRARSKGRREKPCELPNGHSCVGGMHLKWRDGWKVAYERCDRPRRLVERIFGPYTFDAFEAGREDAARDAMLALARSEVRKVLLVAPASEHSGLIPRITTGCGKTHLLRAAQAELEGSGKWVVYLDCYQWQRAKWSDEGGAARDSWARCDVLLVDHLGREQEGDESVAKQLEAVLDQRGEAAMALASDLCRGELVRRYGQRFVSRLWGGAVVPELNGEDYRQKKSGA